MGKEPSQEALRCVQHRSLSQGAVRTHGGVCEPSECPYPPSPLASPRSPSRLLAPASGGENRASGLRRTPQPLGMLRGGTGSAAVAGRARLPFPRAAAPAATLVAPGPRTPLAEASAEGEPSCWAVDRQRPPCPSFPRGADRGGAQAGCAQRLLRFLRK